MPNTNKDYPSNSIMPDPPQKIVKVTKGTVVRREKPILMRLFGDSMTSIGGYILWDVLIPAAKSTISDIITNGIDMLLYGEPERGRGIRRSRDRSYVSYNSLYDNKRDRRDRSPSSRSIKPKTRHSFDDVILASRADGEEVLSTLVELIDQYEVATVQDFYAAVGLDSEWSDNKFGWDNLSTAEVRRVRDGYILVLPRPEPLD